MEDCIFKPIQFTTPCLVCGEKISININDSKIQICEKCRAAILAVRNSEEHKETYNNGG